MMAGMCKTKVWEILLDFGETRLQRVQGREFRQLTFVLISMEIECIELNATVRTGFVFFSKLNKLKFLLTIEGGGQDASAQSTCSLSIHSVM